jgi:hypothetical protein
MIFINEFKYLMGNLLIFEKQSFYLNELLRASCPSPFGPAELFKFAPDEFVRKNLAANLGRSPLIHSYGYESADDQPTLFAIFPLNFVPFMQHTG